jgi:hypothetical protein
MPTEISSLLILILAILPGIPGERIFSRFTGSDWREKEWETIIRILIFSVIGLLVYSSLSPLLKLPEPLYIFPSTFSAEKVDSINLPSLSIAYLCHWLTSALFGLIIGYISHLIAKKTPSLIYPSTWDIFIKKHVHLHWVIISLNNKEIYAGMLSVADLSVQTSERDIVLEEPALYIEEDNNYKSLQYKAIFIPASLISSIAVVHDPDVDQRVTQVNTYLFKE